MASSDPRTEIAADLSSGGAGSVRHSADMLVVAELTLLRVMSGRDTTSASVVSVPPNRYNSWLTMADVMREQLTGSGEVDSHW